MANRFTCTKDMVVKNEILKAQVALEEKARKEWHNKWGFYLDFPKYCIDAAKKRGYTEEQYRRMVEKRKNKQNIELDIWDIEPSDFVPQTSSGYVGWRSASKYSLEKFGRLYISPKHTLPYEPPYSCIILG